MNYGRKIGMRGDTNVKYGDLTSMDKGIRMMGHVCGGGLGELEGLMLIFEGWIYRSLFATY